MGIHMATAQRGPSEATTDRRIPPPASCRTSTFVRRSEDRSDALFRSLAERSEGSQRQDDGYERRKLEDRPDRLPSRKRTVEICEDDLFGYPGSELEQVRGRPQQTPHESRDDFHAPATCRDSARSCFRCPGMERGGNDRAPSRQDAWGRI